MIQVPNPPFFSFFETVLHLEGGWPKLINVVVVVVLFHSFLPSVHIPKRVHHVELKIDSQGLPHYTPPPQVLANFLSDIKATQHPNDQNHDNLHKIPKRALTNYFIFTYHQTVPEDVQRAFEYAVRHRKLCGAHCATP